MKKLQLSTVLLISLSFFTSAFGQNSISLIGGITQSNMSMNGLQIEILDFQPLTGFQTGLLYERELNSNWSGRTGWMLSQRGFTIDESINVDMFGVDLPIGVSVDTKTKTTVIPVAVTYDIMETSMFSWYALGGVNITHANKATLTARAHSIFDFNLASFDIDLSGETFNQWGTEALIGTGIKWNQGQTYFLAEINYAHALNDFANEKTTIVDTGLRNKAIAVNLGIGMRF